MTARRTTSTSVCASGTQSAGPALPGAGPRCDAASSISQFPLINRCQHIGDGLFQCPLPVCILNVVGKAQCGVVEVRMIRPSLYDLQRPELIADPWPLYRWLLDVDGPYWDPGVRSWLVARHADVSRLLDDRRLSAVTNHVRAAAYAPAELRHIFPLLDAHVSFVDGPGHTRIRQVLGEPFKPRHIAELAGWIGTTVADALNERAGTGSMDVVADLALPVPLGVIRYLLGMEDVELAALHRWSTAWGRVVAAPGHLPT